MNMELTILHLCPDCMSLYGEYANPAVLRRHLEAMGAQVTVRSVTCEDNLDFSGADLVYMGAGTERKQKLALEKLLPGADGLKRAADRGALLLFTGNAMELLGTSITDAGGKVWPALRLADFITIETDRRITGDVIAAPALWDASFPAVGFMNKCSATHGVAAPLFKDLPLGFGNESAHGPEGYVSGNMFATHITGPVLVKNPPFLDFLIRCIFTQKGWDIPDSLPVLPHEREAYTATLRELQARLK